MTATHEPAPTAPVLISQGSPGQVAPPAYAVGPVAPIADARQEIRAGLIVAALFFVVFLGWASLVRLDAAAFAPGTLVVAGQRQSVQHRDGGVVGEILVHEGKRVARGDLLITLAAAEVRAQAQALTSQAIRLLAQRARLEAEQLGTATIAPPAEFAHFPADTLAAQAVALRLQQAELKARRETLTAQRGTLGQRGAQSGEQGRGYASRAASLDDQIRLLDDQIEALRPVAVKGFVSATRMRELERLRADLDGQRGQFRASISQSGGAQRENALQVIEAERGFRERTVADLRDVENTLGDVLPRLGAARDQLAHTQIRAPATGAVVGLTVFTPGGVIVPGQKLMDIIPEHAALRIQVRISPQDADDLAVGQKALVRFPSLHERGLPNIEGVVTRISADSFSDERSGASYFTGEVSVAPNQLARIKAIRGADFALRAGLPAEVLIRLRKRTALDYALEPLIGSFWSSFREH